jgi:hypothetical protein
MCNVHKRISNATGNTGDTYVQKSVMEQEILCKSGGGAGRDRYGMRR